MMKEERGVVKEESKRGKELEGEEGEIDGVLAGVNACATQNGPPPFVHQESRRRAQRA
jgi:hypothetical protein